MRKAIAILACALAVAGCRKNEPAKPAARHVITTVIPENARGEKKRLVVRPDVPNVLDKSLLGSTLAPDGTVSVEATEFKSSQPVSLTIWLRESPTGLNTGAIWYGKNDKVINREKRPMNGAKV